MEAIVYRIARLMTSTLLLLILRRQLRLCISFHFIGRHLIENMVNFISYNSFFLMIKSQFVLVLHDIRIAFSVFIVQHDCSRASQCVVNTYRTSPLRGGQQIVRLLHNLSIFSLLLDRRIVIVIVRCEPRLRGTNARLGRRGKAKRMLVVKEGAASYR